MVATLTAGHVTEDLDLTEAGDLKFGSHLVGCQALHPIPVAPGPGCGLDQVPVEHQSEIRIGPGLPGAKVRLSGPEAVHQIDLLHDRIRDTVEARCTRDVEQEPTAGP